MWVATRAAMNRTGLNLTSRTRVEKRVCVKLKPSFKPNKFLSNRAQIGSTRLISSPSCKVDLTCSICDRLEHKILNKNWIRGQDT
jgi:hypothetical protein